MEESEEFEASVDAGRDVRAFQVAVAILVSAMADIVNQLAPGRLDDLTFSGAPDDPEATELINRHLDNLLGRARIHWPGAPR